MGRAVAFFGMLLGERGVLMEASLFRTRPNHVHTYFIKYTAAEYATPKPDGNLTRLSPPRVRVWPARLELAVSGVTRVGCEISLNRKRPNKYLCRQRAPALEREKLVACQKGAFIREAR